MIMDRALREKETSPLEVTKHDIFEWGENLGIWAILRVIYFHLLI